MEFKKQQSVNKWIRVISKPEKTQNTQKLMKKLFLDSAGRKTKKINKLIQIQKIFTVISLSIN
jgi:hypothetical protein